MKQVFKGSVLTLTKTVNLILAVYNRANEKFANDWYKEANAYAWHLEKGIIEATLENDYVPF